MTPYSCCSEKGVRYQMVSRINICDVEIDNVSMEEAVGKIESLVDRREPSYVVTPNLDHIVKLQKDEEFKQIYAGATLVLADGMPVLWGARFLKTPLKEKISGSDLFPRLCSVAADKGYRLFLLGGRPGAAHKASEVLSCRYPNIQIVGIHSPPYGFEKDIKQVQNIIKLIKDSKPDILFVGLGAPKQERWIYKHHKELDVPVSLGIGVTFEFISGIVKRAPLWMQKAGFEWLWRLIKEPRRLWKRYLIDDMKFFLLVLKQRLAHSGRTKRSR